jgi:hypothetical protein
VSPPLWQIAVQQWPQAFRLEHLFRKIRGLFMELLEDRFVLSSVQKFGGEK